MIACNDISLSGTESFVNINDLFCGVFDEFVLYAGVIVRCADSWKQLCTVIHNKLYTTGYFSQSVLIVNCVSLWQLHKMLAKIYMNNMMILVNVLLCILRMFFCLRA